MRQFANSGHGRVSWPRMQHGIAKRVGDRIVLPGIATAHSHAFQRALRGRTERRATAANNFWSWRGLMYAFANALDPETLYAISHFAFVELAMSGVTAVGEFHYVQHQPGGEPYDDRTTLAQSVIRAARDAGLRIALLRVGYQRAGAGKEALHEQKRFCDPSPDLVIQDALALKRHFTSDPLVSVGLAPHSVRAVPRVWIEELARAAKKDGMPFSMHVSEQRREIDECKAEHGKRPVEFLSELGVLDERFVAVHATHLAPNEAKLLAHARAFACLCRTTERDLGDGASVAGPLVVEGTRLCTGIDSYSITDPFEEARAIELDERTHREARHVAAEAPLLLQALTEHGYASLGLNDAHARDQVTLDVHDASLAGADDALLDDAVIFGATPRAIRDVTVEGRVIVENGVHVGYDKARIDYERSLKKVLAVL